jgi:hypothetical protein
MVPCARAGAELRVSGEVVARAPRLEVRVVVTNRGPLEVAPLDVVGELFGERREARVGAGVAPGGEAAVVLDFAAEDARPGLHALTLLLEHPKGATDAAGSRLIESQRAYLLLALGVDPGPAVRIEIACPREDAEADCATTIAVRGQLTARLESIDGESHRVKVRVFTARGLRVDGPPVTVAVPATGPATARIPLARAGAVPGSRHGVLFVAETIDGEQTQTTVAVARVDVAPHPSLLPRLRWPLLVLGLALVVAAGAAEWWRRRPA